MPEPNLVIRSKGRDNSILSVAMGGMRAVRYTADMMANTNCRLLLCSIMRTTVKDSAPQGQDPFADLALWAHGKLNEALAGAKKILTQAGIPEDRIATRIIQGAQSRAGALLDTARAAECDTIVMGRRGISNVESFDTGRIPRKIIYASRKFTIWLIP